MEILDLDPPPPPPPNLLQNWPNYLSSRLISLKKQGSLWIVGTLCFTFFCDLFFFQACGNNHGNFWNIIWRLNLKIEEVLNIYSFSTIPNYVFRELCILKHPVRWTTVSHVIREIYCSKLIRYIPNFQHTQCSVFISFKHLCKRC